MKCWNCGADMHRKEDAEHRLYWWCMDCGATWVELPKPGVLPVTLSRNIVTGEKEYKPRPIHRLRKVKK